ncbi:response regulator [Sphingomonas fuzhouensis]|uniref:response regulator n=1 Tax=Sphingomonas fuzhouensis TaxID=3106033 RepID=UPI002AFF6553|nr:response regulator [Sphingomonas sp. SGZ-02]
MPERTLRGCRILVVEDEFMLADDLATELGDVGAIVLGPVGTLDQALDLVAAEARIDGAILDVNLGGEAVFPAADLLLARAVPLVFTTGYGGSAMPERFGHVVRCEKPISIKLITKAIGRVMRA